MSKYILIPDSFKGSLSSGEICGILGREIRALEPEAEICSIPVADGGEGTVDAFLAALGGCEPQLTSHAGANLRIGNDNAFLIQVISQCLPYIGYPRSLNALRCVNDAAQAAR